MFSSTKQYVSSPVMYYNDFVHKNEHLCKRVHDFFFQIDAYFFDINN